MKRCFQSEFNYLHFQVAIKNTHVARQSPMFPWSQYNPRGSRKNLAVLNNLSQQFFKCANLSQLIIARGGALTNFSSVQSYSFSHSKRPSNFVSSLVDKSCTTFQIFLDILGHKGKIILVFTNFGWQIPKEEDSYVFSAWFFSRRSKIICFVNQWWNPQVPVVMHWY